MSKKIDTKNGGLDIYVHMAKTFADTPWLHYGMWEPDERVVMPNVRRAQERYVDKLMSIMPAAPASVLDIGGGTGAMAAYMISKGYNVEMLTPSAIQVEEARKNMDTQTAVHHTSFENFETDKRFDICLFSESFQYIPLKDSLPRIRDLLNEGGSLVIADCFRKDSYNGELAPGSGHKISDFEAMADELGLEIVHNIDVTESVAPSMIIDQNLYRGFLAPLVDQIGTGLKNTRPILHWFLGVGYKMFTSKDARYRMQERLKADYRSPENFKSVNTYRFLVVTPR